MRLFRTLFRLLIILPIYGSVLSAVFFSVVWIVLKVAISLSTALFGLVPHFNINSVIAHWALLAGGLFIGAGSLLNLIVFVANGLKMPVRDRFSTGVLHRPLDSSTRLPWLADVIPAPLGIRVSIGDLLVFAGLAIVVGLVVISDPSPLLKN
jgi:hypothetical protein